MSVVQRACAGIALERWGKTDGGAGREEGLTKPDGASYKAAAVAVVLKKAGMM